MNLKLTKKRIVVTGFVAAAIFTAAMNATSWLALGTSTVATAAQIQTQRWQNVANQVPACLTHMQSRTPSVEDEKACQLLRTEGIDPDLYGTNADYRQRVNVAVNELILGSAKDAGVFAELTVMFGTDPRAELGAKVLKELEWHPVPAENEVDQ